MRECLQMIDTIYPLPKELLVKFFQLVVCHPNSTNITFQEMAFMTSSLERTLITIVLQSK